MSNWITKAAYAGIKARDIPNPRGSQGRIESRDLNNRLFCKSIWPIFPIDKSHVHWVRERPEVRIRHPKCWSAYRFSSDIKDEISLSWMRNWGSISSSASPALWIVICVFCNMVNEQTVCNPSIKTRSMSSYTTRKNPPKSNEDDPIPRRRMRHQDPVRA